MMELRMRNIKHRKARCNKRASIQKQIRDRVVLFASLNNIQPFNSKTA